MRFKEFASYEWFSFTVDSFAVHILFSASEAGPLLEGKSKSFELGGAYSAQLHQAHTSVDLFAPPDGKSLILKELPVRLLLAVCGRLK